MADKTTKLLLALIALGLWANVVAQYPQTAVAQDWSSIEGHLSNIEDSLNRIEHASCSNRKLC
jgi:hypothetical protein